MKSTEREHNDKIGILFLFTIISVVFFMDIYIEFSRINPSADSISKIERSFIPSDYNNELISQSELRNTDENIYFSNPAFGIETNRNSLIKLSLLFYLIASFSFFYICEVRTSVLKNKILSHYISFVNTGTISYASPRSPPEFV